MKAIDEMKLQAAFVRVANRLIANKDAFVKLMTENIEKVFNKQRKDIDGTTIENRIEGLRKQMANLIKLNHKISLDDTIYSQEYNRIVDEIGTLQGMRSGFAQIETMRRDTQIRVDELAKVMRDMEVVSEFDGELFTIMVERTKVINFVKVEFVLRAGGGVVEVL